MSSYWSNQNEARSEGGFGISSFLRRTVFTFLTILYSQLVLVLVYIAKQKNGSFHRYYQENILTGDYRIYHNFEDIPSVAWKFIFFYISAGIILMKLPKGNLITGPITPSGHQPLYIENGLKAYFLHQGGYLLGAYQGYYKYSFIYDYMEEITQALNYMALFFVLFLYIKGRYFPSTPDSGISGNLMFDLFWGTELYPRVFDIDIKQLTNCRFGMMFWQTTAISCYAAAYERHSGNPRSSMINLILLTTYIFKFFLWESGYFNTIDIMQDRAGYYICWGCLVYLPVMYTSMSVYMVNNNNYLDDKPFLYFMLLFVGLVSIYLNYDADSMKYYFRKNNGLYYIWGEKAKFIAAEYKTNDGVERKSFLLLSGWWGISRHFHYAPEILASYCWSAGSGFYELYPFLYVIYLTVLLIDRAYRDDERCKNKYGNFWDIYCYRVPYRIIPYIF